MSRLVEVRAIVRVELLDRVIRAVKDVGIPRLTVYHAHAIGAGVDHASGRFSIDEGSEYVDKAIVQFIAPEALGRRLSRRSCRWPEPVAAATGSSLERVYECVKRLWNVPSIQVVPPFYDHPAFLDASPDLARPAALGVGRSGDVPAAVRLDEVFEPRAAEAVGEEREEIGRAHV